MGRRQASASNANLISSKCGEKEQRAREIEISKFEMNIKSTLLDIHLPVLFDDQFQSHHASTALEKRSAIIKLICTIILGALVRRGKWSNRSKPGDAFA